MFFKLPTPEAIRNRQIEEAQRAALEHAAAEHHGALAEMYRGRIARLTPPEAPVLSKPSMATAVTR